MQREQLKVMPFFDATKSVFKSMLDMDVNILQESSKLDKEENVRVEIGLTGDISGSIVYNFPKSTTLNIVKTLSGMESNNLDDFATSMLGEMANIISGNAVTSLSGMDCKCDIKPPHITIGSAVSGKDRNSVNMLLHSPAGKMCEHIDLSEI